MIFGGKQLQVLSSDELLSEWTKVKFGNFFLTDKSVPTIYVMVEAAGFAHKKKPSLLRVGLTKQDKEPRISITIGASPSGAQIGTCVCKCLDVDS